MTEIKGTILNETITGTSGNDSIYGDDGNDIIYGGGGNDTISGGNGWDTLYGDAGDDFIYTGFSDQLYGGLGRDIFYAINKDNYGGYESRIMDFTQGEDRIDLSLTGIVDFDTLRGFLTSYDGLTQRFTFRQPTGQINFTFDAKLADLRAADFIFAPDRGPALIVGSTGSDDLIGGSGNDTIDGGYGDDILAGGGGDDRLILREGWDRANGGGGRDTFVLLPSGNYGASFTISDFTPGQDRIDLTAFGVGSWESLKLMMAQSQTGTGGVSFSLARGSTASVTLLNVDTARLSAADFILAQIDSPQEIYGAGISNLFGGSGNDRLHAGGQGGWLFGERGDDILYGVDNSATTMVGGAGNDIFVLPGGITGSTIRISDFVQGQDRLDVSALGISSFDVLKAMIGLPLVSNGYDRGGAFQIGNNTLTLNIAKEKLTAADFILAADQPAHLVVGVGSGGALAGGTGNDTINGSLLSDRMFGGPGDDRLVDDPLETANYYNRDIMVGGAGRDSFIISHIFGRDVIVDFTAGQDKLDLSALGITSMETLIYMADAARLGGKMATVLRNGNNWDGSNLTLLVDRSTLAAGDIIFARQETAVTWQANYNEPDLFGGSAGDTLTGDDNANRLFGEAGNDTLTGGWGNDLLIGGDGTDTAIFAGDYADYRIATVNGITTVKHWLDSYGTDRLIGVEKLVFADRTLNLTTTAATPTLTITGDTVLEGNRGSFPIIVEGKITGSVLASGGADAVFHVQLSTAAAEAVTFDFAYGASPLYSSGIKSYTIAAGQTGLDIRVSAVSGNTNVWSDYTLIGTVSNVNGAFVPTLDGTIHAGSTIFNDDFQADFSLSAYRAMNTELDRVFAGNDAALITHYINNGRQEGRIATGFDAEAYAAQNPDLYKAFGLDAAALLRHYQTAGYKEGRAAEGFDAVAYAAMNPDLYKAYGLNHQALVEHYVAYGEKEGRLASGFDAEAYAALNPDLFRAYGLNEKALVEHFISTGHAEGRAAIGFSAEAYAAFNADLFGAFGLNHSALVQHYINNGQTEGRMAYSLSGFVPPTPDMSMLGTTPGWGQDYYW